MLGLFGTLNLGARSLAAQQLGAEVTGQNLANVNNPAYTRQRVVLQASTPLQTSIGQEGTGVTAVAIQQVRDSLIDNQILAEGSVAGSLNSQQSAMQSAEMALGEQITNLSTGGTSSSPNGLIQGISDLFNAFQSLSNNPSSMAQRQVVVQTAQELAARFNTVASGLTDVRTTLNTSIQSDVAGANQDLSDIASLNKQIVLAQAGGGTANDLIDLRQQKLEDLAGKIKISTAAETNGSVDVSIGGVAMITGLKQTDSLQAVDLGGGQIVVQAQTAATQVSQTGSGGSINGSIDVRDGALATLQTNLNTVAGHVINSINGIYSKGYDLNGNTGQLMFSGTDAATMGVNASLVSDPTTFQASGAPGAAGDNSVVLALAQLGSFKFSGLNNQTITQDYSQTVAGVGQTVAALNDQVSSNTAVSAMLTKQRSAVSGVSLDEEMTNLLQFQKAYQASAELISTVNQMLATVIAMKTV